MNLHKIQIYNGVKWIKNNRGKSSIFSSIFLFLFILITGCSNNCVITNNEEISVSTAETTRTMENIGLSYHYLITVNISNDGDDMAKSLTVNTIYCNNHRSGVTRHCENNTFLIGDLSPKTIVQRQFEYSRDVIKDTTDGGWQLEYTALCCRAGQ